MRAVKDHHVDRPGVEVQQCMELTGTNRSTGLIQGMPRHPQHVSNLTDRKIGKTSITCTAMTWWSWREVYTRSHPELGRENSQRRWYSVSRRGRVGRRQVFTVQLIQKASDKQCQPKPARWYRGMEQPPSAQPTFNKSRAL